MASSQIIILAIIATSIATYISRFMGALTSEKVSVKSKIFKWFNCVAYSTLAALLGRMIVFPAGVLADSGLTIRLLVLIACVTLFIITCKFSYNFTNRAFYSYFPFAHFIKNSRWFTVSHWFFIIKIFNISKT